MNKKNLFKLLFCICIIVFTIFIFIDSFAIDEPDYYDVYYVQQGDTLWSIVKDNCENYKDISMTIDIICKLNNCSSTIYVHQKLILPNWER